MHVRSRTEGRTPPLWWSALTLSIVRYEYFEQTTHIQTFDVFLERRFLLSFDNHPALPALTFPLGPEYPTPPPHPHLTKRQQIEADVSWGHYATQIQINDQDEEVVAIVKVHPGNIFQVVDYYAQEVGVLNMDLYPEGVPGEWDEALNALDYYGVVDLQ